MSKLHELLAVEGDLEGTYKKILQETQITFEKKPGHFFGAHKKLKMFDENAPEMPEEKQELTTTVKDKLTYMAEHIVRYFDAVLQKELTNKEAKADLVVDGIEIAKDLPATFLLGLETKLKNIRAVYEKIPTLPPGVRWEKDETQGKNIYRQTHPEEKFKTAKTFKHKILYQATKEHPAQIEKWEENENVGIYTTERWSGMISPAEKSIVLGKIDKLIRSTKKARQRANAQEIVSADIGNQIFEYINS
jgi:hypothetical protein